MKSAARADVTSKASKTALELALGVALLAVLPYANSLKNGFTFDDVPIVVENSSLRSFAGIGHAFVSDWWDGTRPQSLLYRPLTKATYVIDHAAAGLASRPALPFHLQNLAWHAAASAALCVLVLELFTSPWLAFASAALFAVHPVHTEAVNGIVGRAELMSACFGFITLLAARRARPVLAGVLLFLALLSKEQAIVIPLIPFLWFHPWKSPGGRRLLAGLAIAVVAYLALRTAVLGSPTGVAPSPPGSINVDNPIAGATGAARVWTPLRVFGHAATLLTFPRSLSADYSYDQIPLVASPDLATILSIVALGALAFGAFALRKRAAPVSFGIAFFLLSWLVTSNIPIVIGTIFGERLLYLPSAGVCLAVASALAAVPARRLGAVAIAALALAGFARTWARNPDWKNNAALFASTVATSPRSCKALDGYASELLTAGRPKDAIPWAERALAVYPDYPNAHLTLAKCSRLLATQETDAGRRGELRRRADSEARRVAVAYGSADAWSVLGSVALDDGNVSDALASFRKSVELQPRFVPGLVGLGAAEMGDGHPEAALTHFEQALALDPANAAARQNASAALRELASRATDQAARDDLARRADAEESRAIALGAQSNDAASVANLHGLRGRRLLDERRFPEALAEFREAARLEPQAARAYLGIGTVLATQADAEADAARKSSLSEQAIDAFEHALAVAPDDPTAHLNLGITYLRQRRDPQKVARHFREYLRLVPDSPQRAQMEETIRQMEKLP